MTDVETVALSMVEVLGYDRKVDWSRVYVGNGMEADGSLKALCYGLAAAALAAATPLIETRVRDECAQVADSDGAEWKANGCPAQAMGAFSVAKLLRAALAAQEKEQDR